MQKGQYYYYYKLNFMMNLQPSIKKKDFCMERSIINFQEDDPEKLLKLLIV